ncbi:uncharacterized protein LOC131217371 [Magnolia sinica]|uniref:uncharacterized protein LOC131217371 n=1 Tax=Magnolia sinica TaxID=86752 RepID=UPI00265B38C4|nr:uncharacterized protein LOC131217371 [Magnolia sinica]
MEAVETRSERKRKGKQTQNPKPLEKHYDEANLQLDLSLSSSGPYQLPAPVAADGRSTPPIGVGQHDRKGRPPSTRPQRNPMRTPRVKKHDRVPAPFEWATDRRAMVHTLSYLISAGITAIKGDMKCRRCEAKYQIEHDLESKFKEIRSYITANIDAMFDRAPKEWMNPKLPDCQMCHQTNCIKPVISPKKRSINWLFLFLGKMMGCCTLNQLKYFCKHTNNHRTGAKDRVLYLAYLTMCKQLDPATQFIAREVQSNRKR